MSSIAYLEKAVTAAAEKAVSVKTHQVLGFHFTSADDGKQSRKSQYEKDAEVLREGLAAIGVTPLAIVPASWWSTICDASGLITLQRGDGYDHSFTRLPLNFGAAASTVNWMRTYLGFGLCILIGSLLGAYAAGAGMPIPVAVVVFGSLTGVMTGAYMITMPKFAVVAFSWLYVKLMGRDRVVRRAWRDRTGARFNYSFKLPTPPADVQVTLLKLGQLNSAYLAVHAEPSAFALESKAHRLIADRVVREDIRRREERARLMADPIVTYSNGAAVAIIAQFGNFPIEKAVIDEVCKGTI